MLSIRDIRRRIRSISSTAQITRAMQMVAASKMRRAQQATIAMRPFTRLIYRIQRKASTQATDFQHPLLEKRPVRTRAVILVSPDKGLCGPLNNNLFRIAAQFDPDTTTFIAVGRKAAQFVARTGRRLAAEFTYADNPRFTEARVVAALARDMFLKGEVDEVKVVATRFINTMTQVPGAIEFLPVGALASLQLQGVETEEELAANTTQFAFEPGPEQLLNYLLIGYLNILMFQVLLNARASEQSARMVSMKYATDSANSLIHDLTLEYNKRRQSGITTELLDIADGQASSA
jgi:F-type H+-transporting ATPase subunit gamma